jgi:hypothetical protein
MRSQVKREADKQKVQVLEAFELMKKKGKVTKGSLVSLGLEAEIKEEPHKEDEDA